MSGYVGDVLSGIMVPITFNTGTASGESTDLDTDGTVNVYRLTAGTATLIATSPHASITFSESAHSKLGMNVCWIDTSNALYVPGDYGVTIEDSMINGLAVNGWTGQFSVQWRNRSGLIWRGNAQADDADHIRLGSAAGFADDILIGATIIAVYGTGAGQSRTVDSYAGSSDRASVSPALSTPFDTTTVLEVYGSCPASTAVPTPVNSVQMAGRDLLGAGQSNDKWRG